MNVLGDVVARDRRSETVAVRTGSRAGSYSYAKFCTQAWKAGNLLRHYGVHGGATVAVDTGESLSPPALVAFFGASLLGAAVRFDPGDAADAQALVVPAGRTNAYDAAPGSQVLAYGDDPDDPAVVGFERAVWSENPATPPESVAPDTDALVAGGERFSHGRLLEATRQVVADAGLDGETTVAPRASLAEPGAVVAGVLAPLVAGGTVLLAASETGDVGVGRKVAEPRQVDPAGVLRARR